MKKKVLDICLDGFHVICIRDKEVKYNPFRVYKVSNGHRRQIAKYGDFLSVICFLKDIYVAGVDTFSTPELLKWAKETGALF